MTMGSHEEAAAALASLDSRYTWEGMESPMIVKWMDAALQQRRRDNHLAAVHPATLPPMRLQSARLAQPVGHLFKPGFQQQQQQQQQELLARREARPLPGVCTVISCLYC